MTTFSRKTGIAGRCSTLLGARASTLRSWRARYPLTCFSPERRYQTCGEARALFFYAEVAESVSDFHLPRSESGRKRDRYHNWLGGGWDAYWASLRGLHVGPLATGIRALVTVAGISVIEVIGPLLRMGVSIEAPASDS